VAITETRQLTFDRDAIVEAIGRVPENAFALRVSVESLHDVRFKPDEQAISIETTSPATDGLIVRASDLEMLLVAYCRSLRIPIPRKGEKRFEIAADRATLTILIENPGHNAAAFTGTPPALNRRIA